MFYEKLDGSDIDDLRGQLAPSEIELEQARNEIEKQKDKIINYIISHINTVDFVVECEDDTYDGTLKDFENALALARQSDLNNFFNRYSLPFEDGYIKVKI